MTVAASPTVPDTDPDAIGFGALRLIPSRRLLIRDGRPVRLGGRALDILIRLATHPGELVSHDELIRAAWPNRAVEANNLTVQIAAVRRAVGDGPDGIPIVRTISGRGYMFVAKVSQPASTPQAAGGVRPPLPATRLIGRQSECETITRELTAHRLVTVTGTGGIGKTRLALHLVATLADAYPDGAWFVDLSTTAAPGQVAEAATTTLGIGSGERPAVERLASFLAARRALLVLDNCEHVIDAVSRLVGSLLHACPNLSILATSRESLFVPGEVIVRLPPLSVPATADAIDAATALRHDAVALFVERATATVPGFQFGDSIAPAITRICSSVDGIALAIEMAVPRLRVLPPGQLADRLAERLLLPAHPTRGMPPRHRTLRATIDWSFGMLQPEERALLCHLSLFAGGADLAAVMAVAAPAATDLDLLDRLGSLAEKSLVVVDGAPAQRRFRLLEPIRHYAADKHTETGDRAARHRHALHFVMLFETAEAQWPVVPTGTWLARYEQDVDNLRAALAWAFGPDGDATLGVRLVAASYPLWWDLPQMPVPEGREWHDRALPHVTGTTPSPVAARFWLGASWRDMRYNDRASLPAAERAVALFRDANDAMGLGGALWRLGATLFAGHNATEALALCQEAERLLRPLGASKWLVMALIRLADTAMFQRRLDDALPLYQEARAMADSLDHWYGQLVSTTNMAELLYDLGQAEQAITLLQDLRGRLSPRRRAPLLAPLVSHLLLAERAGEWQDAAQETITLAAMLGLGSALGWVCEALAMVQAQAGDAEGAARLAGFARRIHPASASRIGARRAVLLRLQRRLRADLPPARRARLLAEGAAWSEAYAASQALLVRSTGIEHRAWTGAPPA